MNHDIVMFADNTSLIFKIKRGQNIYDDVNNSLWKVVHWFSVNNLLLNSKKRKCKIFKTPNTIFLKLMYS